jgi:hypothetical protein
VRVLRVATISRIFPKLRCCTISIHIPGCKTSLPRAEFSTGLCDSRPSEMRIVPCAQFFLVFLPALAVPKNRTIDDTYGDSVTGELPVYWHTWNASPCAQCSVQPDLSKARRGTWHSTKSVNTDDWMTVNLTFTGVHNKAGNVTAYHDSDISPQERPYTFSPSLPMLLRKPRMSRLGCT